MKGPFPWRPISQRKQGSVVGCRASHCAPPRTPRIRDALAPDHQRAPEHSAGGRPPRVPGEHPWAARDPGGQRGCSPRLDGALGARVPAGPHSGGAGTARRAAGSCRLRPPPPGACQWHVRPAALGARATKFQGRRGFSITSAQSGLPRAPLPSSSTGAATSPRLPAALGRKRPLPAPLRAWRGRLRAPERGGRLGGPVPQSIALAPRDRTPTRHFGVEVCGPGPTGKERMRFRRLRDSHAQPSPCLYLWRLGAAGREPCRGSFPSRGRGLLLGLRPGREHAFPRRGAGPGQPRKPLVAREACSPPAQGAAIVWP